MGETQKRSKTMSGHGFSQFELTKDLLNNLQQFNITPVAKLVLLYLSSCYNPNKADIFPKQKTIADKIGVSDVSVTRAISELHKEGLIVSERKYTNRYKFTARILFERVQSEQNNLIDEKLQNDSKETIKMIGHEHEQIKEQKNNNKKKVVSLKFRDEEIARPQDHNKLVDLQTNCRADIDDFEILKDYAQRNGARNVSKYVSFLKAKGLDKKIIADYKAKRGAEEFAKKQIVETKKLIEEYKSFEGDAPTQNWKDLKKKLVMEV